MQVRFPHVLTHPPPTFSRCPSSSLLCIFLSHLLLPSSPLSAVTVVVLSLLKDQRLHSSPFESAIYPAFVGAPLMFVLLPPYIILLILLDEPFQPSVFATSAAVQIPNYHIRPPDRPQLLCYFVVVWLCRCRLLPQPLRFGRIPALTPAR